MKQTFILDGLDCASCANKIETDIKKLNNIKACNVVLATKTMVVETKDKEDLMIRIKEAINTIDADIKVRVKTQLKRNTLDTKMNTHLHLYDGIVSNQSIENRSLLQAKQIQIKGLDCANCAMKIENKINALVFVEKAILNFSTQILQVKTNSQIADTELLKILQEVIDGIEDGVTISFKKEAITTPKPKLFSCKENGDVILGTLLFIASFIITDTTISMIVLLASYIIAGYKVLLKAFKNILKLEIFDENFLMCIATIGAIAIGEYREAVAVMLFYSVGEVFQSFAVNKTRNSISSLMNIKSEYANILIDNNIKQVAPENVLVGDIMLVKVGEKIPLDGIVVKGSSTLDTSSLTGESMPRNVTTDEEVLAGVINLTEVLKIRVTKPYEDSTVAKILELMENAASKKAPIEKFITRFARIYTPTVVILAVLLTIIPMLVIPGAILDEWLYRSLTFLVVSCPCALVISIPLGLYAGLGKASKLGVLIKGGNYLELLKNVDTIVFDKTGTLTKGKFEVTTIHGDDTLLEYAAYGEFLSNHPIAKSILNAYPREIDQSRIQNFKEIAGKGIEVTIDKKEVLLGNETFFAMKKIRILSPKEIGTIIHIAIDGQYQGYIVVSDILKESSKKGIEMLKKWGIKNTVMLTGDHHNVANYIADVLKIDTVYSELLPQDKVTKVEALMQKDTTLAFVGDGINDAPVLARADIGIAMGGIGSDAAIEAADVVLMQDDITAIAKAISVSKKTNEILRQNVIFTLFIKMGVLILTMIGLSNMWMGVFADVGVTLLAILNAMRTLK